MMWLLKLFNQNLIMINYKFNDDFNSHIFFGWTQDELVALLLIFINNDQSQVQ